MIYRRIIIVRMINIFEKRNYILSTVSFLKVSCNKFVHKEKRKRSEGKNNNSIYELSKREVHHQGRFPVAAIRVISCLDSGSIVRKKLWKAIQSIFRSGF